MSNFSVVKYNSGYKSVWDNFVANSKNGTFLFQRDFMEYHQDRFVDYSLLVFKAEKLVALLPANITDNELISHQGLTYGGLLLDAEVKFDIVLESFKCVLKFLNKKNIKILKIKLIPKIYHDVPSEEIDYLLFVLKAKLNKRDTLSVINLKKNFKISNGRLEGCKRAKKHELKIKEENDLSSFWNKILIPNLEIKHNIKPVHTIEEITFLKNKFTYNIRQFNVYRGNNIVAGATVFDTKNVAHVQYISGNNEKNELGSLDFLHVYLFEKIFNDKNYFDFGISNENNGRAINRGLQFWKEGFGARTIVHDFYEIKTSNYNLLEDVFI